MVHAATSRFFTLLLSLSLLAGAGFVYALLVKPEYISVNELRGEIVSRKAALKEQEQIVESLMRAIGDAQGDIAAYRENVSLALPNKIDYPTLTNQISALIKMHRLSLESLDFGLIPAPARSSEKFIPTFKVLQIKLQLSGSYEAFKSFLSSLETNIRVMDIISFDAVVSQSNSNYTYDVVVNTYYQEL